MSSSSTLFGCKVEQVSQNLAQKLAKKFNQQVFVSCSLPYDEQLNLQIEKWLTKKLSINS